MNVYRVERPDGAGPYRIPTPMGSTSIRVYLHPDGYDNRRHPMCPLAATRVVYPGSPWIYGFPSRTAYRRWYATPWERGVLAAFGFTLATYSVPHQYYDRIVPEQCVFHRKYAVLVRRQEIRI